MRMNKVVKHCMMMAVAAIVFVVYPSSSYGQDDCSGFAYCNPTTGYEISSQVVLAEPSGALAVGQSAMPGNTSQQSTAVGNTALNSNTTGEHNTAVGYSALESNTVGVENVAVGQNALVHNTTTDSNTAVGYGALFSNAGGDNTAVGDQALSLSTGSSNTAVGWHTCANVTTASNVICIGPSVAGTNVSGTTYVAGIYNIRIPGRNNPLVCIDKAGQLGTKGCSRYGQPSGQQEAINQQLQQVIADLQQRLSRLESIIQNHAK